jgi:conjugative relaxase-like TrwC/TraI family protein
MVASLSKAMSQEALERYHSKDNYYSQGEGLGNSQWCGEFAEAQGLTGVIKSEDWKQACKGKDPQGKELRRKQMNSRAGWDITLSACKSASLKALVDQDPIVLSAHQEAVLQTVQYIESYCIYAQVKINGQLTREQTQKGQFSLFEHDDNRNQEPQLHTHVVILNQTLCADGKSRTLDSRELFIQKKTIGAYYDHCFANQLQKKGFELEWTSDHTFEIKGYQKDQLEAFSGRRQQIREYLEQQNISLAQATAEQKAIACLESRPVKIHKLQPIDHELQRQAWQQESDRLGIIHPQPSAQFQQLYELNPHPGSLHQVIKDGIESATAYQVAVTRQELLRHCLRQAQAHYSPIEVEQALDQSPDLVTTLDGRWTTTRTLDREQFVVTSANQGQNTQSPLNDAEIVTAIAQRYELNEGQTAGLKHIATSTDFITLLQGNAGVGKTYTLKAFRDCLPPDQRDKLRGLAPSVATAETLTQDTDIPAATVDRYLFSTPDPASAGDILLVEEAGMLSVQQMEQLIQKAQDTQSRLILVGDTKQLSSIEAGAPFRLLQTRSDLKTVTIEQNLRQKAPHLFIAADLAAQRRTDEAISVLERCHCIHEIPVSQERNRTVVSQYLDRTPQEQAQTLILCDTNSDRRDITAQIRAAYVAEGRLGETSQTIQILYPKHLDKQAIAQGYNYQPGDVIRFWRTTQALPDAYYRVMEVKDQSLILKDRRGQQKELMLNRHKEREVFQCQTLELREGDRLRFTRNHRQWQQTNGQPYTIEALNPDGTIAIRTKGQRYTVTADQLLHSDYAYCRTVYSAQGWTSKAAIWAPGYTPGQEQTYVALTRAQEHLEIITLDRAAFIASATQSRGQENATELLDPQLSIPAPAISQPSQEEIAIAQQPSTEPSEANLDPQQLTLFPGQTDELQRKPARQRRTQPPAQSGRSPESDRGMHQPDQQMPQTNPETNPETEPAANPPTAEQPLIPARSRLAELADAFGTLAEQLDPHRAETRTDRGDEPDRRPDPESESNLSEPNLNPEPDVSEYSAIGDATAAIDPAAPDPGYPAADLIQHDPDGLTSGETADSRPGQSLESDSSLVEREGVEHQGDSDYLRGDDSERQPVEFVAGVDGIEREVLPNVGEDERTVEQHREPAEEVAQTEVGETEALSAIASQWSDRDLLDYEQQVKEYFKTILPEPDWEEGKRLQTEANRWSTEYHQAARVYRDCQEEVKRLGEPRSLWYPFGSPRQEVEAARGRADGSRSELAVTKVQLDQVQGKFKKWKTAARQYQEWRHSERGELMHQVRAIVETEPVQERIQQVHQAQEAIRQAQERQRRRQEVLEMLQQWQQIAIRIGQPDGYVQRIQAITRDYERGQPLTEKQIDRLSQDFTDYREQMRQVQTQRQQQRGFGR